ncbi:glycosyl hydrolase 108 family protein [Mesorhizobium sp. IMUNJ 23033]|uniref:glycosyl hydrolase 108 family protein n=1 Tax=Mesorhizobium sp. IMUNJ 23033 TaxID=3378039 RepID=UPI00384BFAAC
MDRNFSRALALVLKSKGEWLDNPVDPGGATMKGVTLANFRRYVKADASKADLPKISDAQIATVYRRIYWDAVAGVGQGGRIGSATLAAVGKMLPVSGIDKFCDNRLASLKRLPTWPTFGRG